MEYKNTRTISEACPTITPKPVISVLSPPQITAPFLLRNFIKKCYFYRFFRNV